MLFIISFFFFSSRRRHTRLQGDWSSDVCSSDLSVIESDTSFSLTPGSSKRRMRSSFVSYMSTTGIQTRLSVPVAMALGRAKKPSNSRFISLWISGNGSHCSTEVANGRQRSIAISNSSFLDWPASLPALIESVIYISDEYRPVKSAEIGVQDPTRKGILPVVVGWSWCDSNAHDRGGPGGDPARFVASTYRSWRS